MSVQTALKHKSISTNYYKYNWLKCRTVKNIRVSLCWCEEQRCWNDIIRAQEWSSCVEFQIFLIQILTSRYNWNIYWVYLILNPLKSILTDFQKKIQVALIFFPGFSTFIKTIFRFKKQHIIIVPIILFSLKHFIQHSITIQKKSTQISHLPCKPMIFIKYHWCNKQFSPNSESVT